MAQRSNRFRITVTVVQETYDGEDFEFSRDLIEHTVTVDGKTSVGIAMTGASTAVVSALDNHPVTASEPF